MINRIPGVHWSSARSLVNNCILEFGISHASQAFLRPSLGRLLLLFPITKLPVRGWFPARGRFLTAPPQHFSAPWSQFFSTFFEAAFSASSTQIFPTSSDYNGRTGECEWLLPYIVVCLWMITAIYPTYYHVLPYTAIEHLLGSFVCECLLPCRCQWAFPAYLVVNGYHVLFAIFKLQTKSTSIC